MPMCHANSLYFATSLAYCGAACTVYSRASFDAEHALRLQPPALGEHTDEILGSVGYDNDAIDGLKARRVVLDGIENLFSAFADERLLRAENPAVIVSGSGRNPATVPLLVELAELLGLAISKPRFDEEAIERMRTAVLSEVNNRLVDPDDITRFDMSDPTGVGLISNVSVVPFLYSTDARA